MRRVLLAALAGAAAGSACSWSPFCASGSIPSNTTTSSSPTARILVDPLVRVQADTSSAAGGIYFVDIFVRKASLIERLWPRIHEGAELVPKSALLAPGAERQRSASPPTSAR
mgnify:CR=1 FL=1